MNKRTIVIIFLLTVGLIINTGCIENKVTNTWGEKNISIDALKVSDTTKGVRNERNDSIYYVYGNITNQNPYDAFKVKINITVYYSNGTIFAVNQTPYLNPKSIPAKGNSYFYARFVDPTKQIARYEVKILDAKAEYL